MKKNIALFATGITVLATLSACSPPQPESTNIDISQPPVLENSQLETNQQKDPPMPVQNRSEKTLSDFKDIPASQAAIQTSKGEIVVELYRDKVPLTTANFVNLAADGFYDGIVFHRVIPGFMAQVGDPKTKDPSLQAEWGTGGPGYVIADEFDPTLTHDGPGVLSMANAGPNTGGSQFFITYDAQPHLDNKHAVFGRVISGMDVLESITQGDTIQSITLK